MAPWKPLERLLLVHRLGAIGIADIATGVNRSEAFVRGFLKRIRDKFEALLKSVMV